MSYLEELEVLREENEKLKAENQLLKTRLQKYESEEDEYCEVSGVKLDKSPLIPKTR